MTYKHTFYALAVAALVSAGSTHAAETIVALPMDAAPWAETPEGVSFAALQGDRFQESYMAMVKLPAGTTSPAHVKTATMFGVMISGEMVHYAAGQQDADHPVLGAGAYYKIPANLPHVSACVSDVECVTFLYQDGAFDFVPVVD